MATARAEKLLRALLLPQLAGLYLFVTFALGAREARPLLPGVLCTSADPVLLFAPVKLPP